MDNEKQAESPAHSPLAVLVTFFSVFSYQLESVGWYFLIIFIRVWHVSVLQPEGSITPAELSWETQEGTVFIRQSNRVGYFAAIWL